MSVAYSLIVPHFSDPVRLDREDIEVIAVNDCSTDQGASAAERDRSLKFEGSGVEFTSEAFETFSRILKNSSVLFTFVAEDVCTAEGPPRKAF